MVEGKAEDNTPLNVPHGGGVARTPYPDYDVASDDKWKYDWDDKTRRLVRDRVENVPHYAFFLVEEQATLEALCARLIPQNDRTTAQRIPIAPWIDERLAKGEGDGYRYEEMPDDREAYRQGLKGVDETAIALCGGNFSTLTASQQDKVVHAIAGGSPPGAIWESLSASRFFQELMSEVITNYYAHPSAWAEIGFSGPASPRGHVRLAYRERDPWEAKQQQEYSSVDIVKRALQQKDKSGE